MEDITEIKQFEQRITALLREKELLLKESHHRIKNNMGALSGLLNYHVEFSLDASKVTPLGILLIELTTNSMKHAFHTATSNPKISVNAVTRGNTVRVEYHDNGIPWEPPQDRSSEGHGFGLALIEMLVEQLDGTLSVHADRGTRYVMEFPV